MVSLRAQDLERAVDFVHVLLERLGRRVRDDLDSLSSKRHDSVVRRLGVAIRLYVVTVDGCFGEGRPGGYVRCRGAIRRWQLSTWVIGATAIPAPFPPGRSSRTNIEWVHLSACSLRPTDSGD